MGMSAASLAKFVVCFRYHIEITTFHFIATARMNRKRSKSLRGWRDASFNGQTWYSHYAFTLFTSYKESNE